MSRVDLFEFTFLLSYFSALFALLFSGQGQRTARPTLCLLVMGFLFAMTFTVFDVARLAEGRAHYELRDQSDGTRAWKYVETKKGN